MTSYIVVKHWLLVSFAVNAGTIASSPVCRSAVSPDAASSRRAERCAQAQSIRRTCEPCSCRCAREPRSVRAGPRDAGARAWLHAEDARRPAPRRALFPQYVLRRDVESRPPDHLQALQRRRSHRLRARFPARETGTGGADLRPRAAGDARNADAGAGLRRLRLLRLVRVGLRERAHDAEAGGPAAPSQ